MSFAEGAPHSDVSHSDVSHSDVSHSDDPIASDALYEASFNTELSNDEAAVKGEDKIDQEVESVSFDGDTEMSEDELARLVERTLSSSSFNEELDRLRTSSSGSTVQWRGEGDAQTNQDQPEVVPHTENSDKEGILSSEKGPVQIVCVSPAPDSTARGNSTVCKNCEEEISTDELHHRVAKSLSLTDTAEFSELRDSASAEEDSADDETCHSIDECVPEPIDSLSHDKRSQTPPPKETAMFTISQLKKKFDSVDSIMDRIDTELMSLKRAEMPARAPLKFPQTNGTGITVQGHGTTVPGRTQIKLSASSTVDTGIDSALTAEGTESTIECIDAQSSINGQKSLSIYPLDSEESGDDCSGGNHSDLDSDAASAVDARFSDVLRKKQFGLGGRISVIKTQEVKSLETDSIRTEDFETAFRKVVPSIDPGLRATHYPVSQGGESDTPLTEDFEEKFQSTLVEKPTLPRGSSMQTATSTVRRKLQEVDRGGDTLDELSDLEQEQMNATLAPFASNQRYNGSSDSEEGDLASEIRKQSSRIQKEMELERKIKGRQSWRPTNHHSSLINLNGQTNPNAHRLNAFSASTPDVSSSYPIQNEVLMRVQLAEENDQLKKLNKEKIRLLDDIGKLQDSFKRMEEEMLAMEQRAKDNRSRAEEARSHLMVAEFKKEAVLKEVNRLTGEIEENRRIIRETENRRQAERDMLESFGLNKEEISDLVSERNQLRELVERQKNSLELEKTELGHKLSAVKQEMSNEQKGLLDKIAALEKSLELVKAQLDLMTLQKDSLSKEKDAAFLKVVQLEEQLEARERAREMVLADKSKEMDSLRERLQRELIEVRVQLNTDINATRRQLELETDKTFKLTQELEHRDQLNQKLRDELDAIRAKAAEEEESHDTILKNLKQQMKVIEQEKLSAFEKCRQQFELEKLTLLEGQRDQLETRHQEILITNKNEHSKQIAQQQELVHGKEEEIRLLRTRLTQQEEASRKQIDRVRADAKDQLEQAIEKEHQMWEKEQKYVENQQLKQLKDEFEKHHAQITEQLETEQRRAKHIDNQNKSLKAELEESQQVSQRLQLEKMQAVTKSREAAIEEKIAEFEQTKRELVEEQQKMVHKLRLELTEKGEELQKLKQEQSVFIQQESEKAMTLEKLERMIISEINEECRKTAELLGVQPRQATIGSMRSSSPHKKAAHRRSISRSLAASAIANLRACNEELRHSITELREEVAQGSEALRQSERDKELEIEQIRKRVSLEKDKELEDTRKRLIQVPLSNGYKDCHDSYVTRLEKKSADRCLRRSLEIPNSVGIKENGSAALTGELADHSASHTLQSVQDRLRQLRSPWRTNQLAMSSPDISTCHNGLGLDNIEQKVRLAELKAKLAEERANRNQALLSQKMDEVNQLQNSLNNQTRELVSLERSFEDLRSASYSPKKYSLGLPH